MPVVINGTTGISPVSAAGTSASIDGMTVGRGGGEVSTNTAVGTSALAANTTGAQHTAVGYQALTAQASATSAGSTAVGYQAGLNYNNADAVGSSTFVGFWAGKTTSTGTDNTFVGGSSGQLNTTGGYNAGLGGATLQINTTGSYNTAVGMQALRNNTTASNNTAIGYQAGYTANGGARNTVVGYKAGYALTTGNTNTFIGVRSDGIGAAGAAITTGSNNTIIGGFDGNNGTLDIRTASNYIVMSDGDGNPRMYYNNSDSQWYDLYGKLRAIPQNSQTSAYVLVATDVGKHISITTGGVTCNASVFSAGDAVSIYNNSGSNQTITAGASVTFRLAGTATTGNRTLAQYGVATLLCVTGGATPVFVVSGAGVT